MLKYILPLFYGVFVSIAYVLYRYLDLKGGLLLFFHSSIISCILLLPLSLSRNIKSLISYHLLTRGCIFSLTQIFIFKAQEYSFSSDVILASITGTISGILLSRVILKEKISFGSILSFTLCVVGVVFYEAPVMAKLFGAISGGLISAVLISSKHVVQKSHKAMQILFASFFWSTIITGLFIFLFEANYQVTSMNIQSTIVATVILISLQLYYILMFKKVSASIVSSLILTRVPAAFLLEFLIYNRNITSHIAIISSLILLAALIPVIEKLLVSLRILGDEHPS